MRSTRYLTALTACAAIMGGWAPVVAAQSQLPDCPTIHDQVVTVSADTPTEFTIDVDNLGRGLVSIFQSPLGGTVMQSGSSQLDFTFIPDDGYTGTTYFTYRVAPETGCHHQALLGRVTLAGPTTGKPFMRSEPASLCGVSAATAVSLTGLLCLGLARRRKP